MDFIINARLGRGQYWLALVCIILGGGVLLGVLGATGVARPSSLGFLLVPPLMGWALAARARDAGRNVIGWTLAGLFVPFCWIVVGCFSSHGAFDRATLRRTFE